MSSLMTVVFVDIEGSTELLTRLGDRDGLAAIERVLAEVRDRVDAYGGREVKSLGDGSMLVFPSPRQAITFAVAVQGALGGRRPLLRVGINTGEVTVVGDDLVGEAVSATARIGDRAEGGEVLVSEVVRHLVGTMPGVHFGDRGRHRLRGFPERWRLYRVTGADSASDRLAVFGRDRELDAIDWMFAGVAGGTGRILVFEGEAGIGKTHLVNAARARSAERGVDAVAGDADDLERDQPGRLLFLIGNELRVDLRAVVRDLPEGGAAAIEGFIEAIEERVAGHPLVVIAEDLHWADDLSLRALAALVRHTKSLPVGLLATIRPAPRPPALNQLLDRLDRDSGRLIHLDGLDATALAALVSTHYGAPPGRALSRWLDSTAGNPLFVMELARSLDDGGALIVANGVVDTSIEQLPDSLRETVVRRLSALTTDCNELLRLASLLGGDFTLVDLATISGRSVVSVAAQLHEAVDTGILAGAGDTLSFRHDLIRDAVYNTMVPAIRGDLHAAAARALAASGAAPSQVARHFSLGARAGDADAATWLARAAMEVTTLQPSVAVDLLEQALEIAPVDWEGREEAELALLDPLAHSGRVDDARVRAVSLLEHTANPMTQFAIRRGLAAVLASAGDLANASVQCELAVATADAPVADARIVACLGAGQRLLLGSDPNQAIATAEGAMLAGGDGDALLTSVAHQTLALAAAAQCRFNDAFDHARIASRAFNVRTMPRMGFLIPDIWEGSFNFYADKSDEGIEINARVGRDSEKRGEMILLVQTSVGSGGINFIIGRWDDAVRDLESGLAVADETGAHAQLVSSNGVLAMIALGRGDLAGADRHLAAGHAALADGLHLFGIDLLLWANAQMLEAADDANGAREMLNGLWEQTESLRGLLQYRNIAPDLVRLAAECGDDARAHDVASEVASLAQRSTVPSARATALRCEGLADRNVDRLFAAIEVFRATPRRIELAACCEEAARLLVEEDRIDEAAALLDEAAAVHQQSGAASHLARVDAMLPAHGRRRRRSRPAPAAVGWEALSPKEREVAEHVAHGLSNPQIGERLYISRRTVETHVAHIFRKLGVTNRAELASVTTRRYEPNSDT